MDLYLYYYYLISCKHTFLLLAWENRVMYNTDRTVLREGSRIYERRGTEPDQPRCGAPTPAHWAAWATHVQRATFNFSPQPLRKTKQAKHLSSRSHFQKFPLQISSPFLSINYGNQLAFSMIFLNDLRSDDTAHTPSDIVIISSVQSCKLGYRSRNLAYI